MKKYLLLQTFAFLSASPFLQALPLRFLAWDDAIASRKLAVVGGKAEPIKGLHPLQRSETIAAALGEQGLMMQALDRLDKDGKPTTFKVIVAAGVNHPLVLLLPDAKSPTGLAGVAIEDSTGSFPWGTFRVINGTGQKLGIVLGKERKALSTDWVPVDLKPEGAVPLAVSIVSGVPTDRPMFSSVWKPEANIRRLVILAKGTDARLGPLAIKIIPEDRTEVEVPATTGPTNTQQPPPQ